MTDQMTFAFETLTAEFTDDRAIIHQDFAAEAAFVRRILMWVAAGGGIFLTAVGNIPFAVFWFVFLMGVLWFIKRHSSDFRTVVIDKTTGQITTTARRGKLESDESYDLAQFERLVVLWTRDLNRQSGPLIGHKRYRYKLSLYRSMPDEQVEAELPDHLAAGLEKSAIAAKLLLHTARAGGVNYVNITHGDLKSEQDVRRLSDALMQFLTPEYDLVADDKHAPSMFRRIYH